MSIKVFELLRVGRLDLHSQVDPETDALRSRLASEEQAQETPPPSRAFRPLLEEGKIRARAELPGTRCSSLECGVHRDSLPARATAS
jgi:hypothetical protein